MGGVALLKVLDDAEGVEIMVEAAAVTLETLVEGALAGVTERGMADVMDEGESFGQIFVEPQGSSGGAGDLGDLDGVGEAAAEVVGGAAGEDLGFACKTTEGACLHNAFSITLKGRARGAKRRGIDAGQKRIVRVSCDRASMQIDWHVYV